jgi:glucuronate isomerase
MALRKLVLDEDRLFPAEAGVRSIARALYQEVKSLPIISPHGHTDPAWFAGNEPFANATELLLTPDHYLLRMLYSQGVPLEALGVVPVAGPAAPAADARAAWRTFASHYHLFRGTPSRLWLDWVFAESFGLEHRLEASTADQYFDRITSALQTDAFRPRALFERYNIEVLATTESPVDDLRHHKALRASGWTGRVITAYRPDPVVDPQFEGFLDNLELLAALTGEDTHDYDGYLAAHRQRRAFFKSMGATSTDHGHPTASTADLGEREAQALFRRVIGRDVSAADAELFRAHMLTVMAGMSLEDGLVMQIHPGSFRNHNPQLFARFGSCPDGSA